MHQLRVATVGIMLCRALPRADEQTVVLVALFHDMGNIIKSDLTMFPEFLEPQGIGYWQGVKDEFIRTYGPKTGDATRKILEEMGMPSAIVDLVSHLSFSEIPQTVTEGPLEKQIAKYADMRVGPYGIVPLKDRLDDLRARYSPRWERGEEAARAESFARNSDFLIQLEEKLFAEISLRPEDVNDTAAAPIIEELKQYPV